ncbi:MAG TPA: DnaJ domain-containing protein [Bryobacteraceae bacterium]|nr:DnaJ domain-containing protein [Bryobacteraceae bacterium]
MPDEPFVDYYQLLQVSASAEPETIQRVCRAMANWYHPDNPDTGDAARYARILRANEILCRRETRAAYDAAYQAHSAKPFQVFERKEFAPGMENEQNRRLGILCLLYSRRRVNPESAGLSILDLENQTGYPREHLHFTLWCLKEADLIRQVESTDFAISGSGVEHVEKNLPSNAILYELVKAMETGDSARSPVSRAVHNTV